MITWPNRPIAPAKRSREDNVIGHMLFIDAQLR
jgi:hypothetical protein